MPGVASALVKNEYTVVDNGVAAKDKKYKCNACNAERGRNVKSLYSHYQECSKVSADKKDAYNDDGSRRGTEKGFVVSKKRTKRTNDDENLKPNNKYQRKGAKKEKIFGLILGIKWVCLQM
eukprot:192175_1